MLRKSKNNQLIIREYQSADYQELMILWEKTGFNTPGRGDDENIIENTISVGGKLFILFDKKNECIIGSSWITNDGRRLYLHHFGIHPEYQSKGLSKLLLSKSLAFAKELNLQIKLEVHKDNIIAKSLYQKADFAYLGDYEVYIIRDISSIKL